MSKYINQTNSISGGNITDIPQLEALKLIVKYWSTRTKQINTSTIFVGDVHGDLHQFLAPLILSGFIKLTGKIVQFKPFECNITDSSNYTTNEYNYKYPESIIYIPEFELNKSCNTSIIYLGDLIDEWIFSRNIVALYYTIYKLDTKRLFWTCGNHDLSVIGRIGLFENNKLNVPYDLPALWNTMKRELNAYSNIKIYQDKLIYSENSNSLNESNKLVELNKTSKSSKNSNKNKHQTNTTNQTNSSFIHDYLKPLFETIKLLYLSSIQYSKLAYLNDLPIMISHTTWSVNSIMSYINNSPKNVSNPRPNDNDSIQNELFCTSSNINKITENTNSIISMLKNNKDRLQYNDYLTLYNLINSLGTSRTYKYICNNTLTYTRSPNNVIMNQIVGHSPGGAYRDLNVNVESSTYNNERIKKLEPMVINDCRIWYFDFGCSAGYDHDEISRPDFVYVMNDGFVVSNLDAFVYGRTKDKWNMLIYKGKTREVEGTIELD